MKAYEFPAKIRPEGSLDVPDALVELLPENSTVRVIILVDESADSEEHMGWSRLTAEQFLEGYSEADSIYDKSEKVR